MIHPIPADQRLLDAFATIKRQAARPANAGVDRAVVRMAGRRLIGRTA